MNNGIVIEFKHPYQKMMRGIYKITIGNKFYIGKTRMLAQRSYSHSVGINGCLKRFAMPKKEHSHYWRVARYLHENPRIRTCWIEIIQRCVSEEAMYNLENEMLSDHKYNPDCLNGAFHSTKRWVGKQDEWDAKVADNEIYYFDPAKPYKLFIHSTPLTQKGFIKELIKRKKYKPKPKPYMSNADKLAQLKNTIRRIDEDFHQQKRS